MVKTNMGKYWAWGYILNNVLGLGFASTNPYLMFNPVDLYITGKKIALAAIYNTFTIAVTDCCSYDLPSLPFNVSNSTCSTPGKLYVWGYCGWGMCGEMTISSGTPFLMSNSSVLNNQIIVDVAPSVVANMILTSTGLVYTVGAPTYKQVKPVTYTNST